MNTNTDAPMTRQCRHDAMPPNAAMTRRHQDVTPRQPPANLSHRENALDNVESVQAHIRPLRYVTPATLHQGRHWRPTANCLHRVNAPSDAKSHQGRHQRPAANFLHRANASSDACRRARGIKAVARHHSGRGAPRHQREQGVHIAWPSLHTRAQMRRHTRHTPSTDLSHKGCHMTQRDDGATTTQHRNNDMTMAQ